MAQTAAVILLQDPEFNGMTPIIGAIDNVRFRRQVIPGDQLIMDIELLKLRGTIGKVAAKASVEGEVAAEMEMTFKLVPNEEE
jgi:3-hydroxymyristoyl/3-hydroxydecanoyl-(acyl carrier protein) dehydratase